MFPIWILRNWCISEATGLSDVLSCSQRFYCSWLARFQKLSFATKSTEWLRFNKSRGWAALKITVPSAGHTFFLFPLKKIGLSIQVMTREIGSYGHYSHVVASFTLLHSIWLIVSPDERSLTSKFPCQHKNKDCQKKSTEHQPDGQVRREKTRARDG